MNKTHLRMSSEHDSFINRTAAAQCVRNEAGWVGLQRGRSVWWEQGIPRRKAGFGRRSPGRHRDPVITYFLIYSRLNILPGPSPLTLLPVPNFSPTSPIFDCWPSSTALPPVNPPRFASCTTCHHLLHPCRRHLPLPHSFVPFTLYPHRAIDDIHEKFIS